MGNDEWAARNEKPKRSVFSNFKSDIAEPQGQPEVLESPAGFGLRQSSAAFACGLPVENGRGRPPSKTQARKLLQDSIDQAVARAFLYQFLARAFEDPTTETWSWLTYSGTHAAFHSAVGVLSAVSVQLEKSAASLTASLRPDRLESFQIAYVTAFGHAARGDCPLNEIEYGDLKADPLFQPHRLADLAAFYRAFGLEVADAAAERPDHIGMELEFMSVLAAKEAYAHEHQLDDDQATLCYDAQRKFLREHLGRWSPAFARRLARAATNEALAALAEFTRDFIATDCACFGLPAGSEDLLLRPVDEAAESVCASCGLQNLPPGAAAPAATT